MLGIVSIFFSAYSRLIKRPILLLVSIVDKLDDAFVRERHADAAPCLQTSSRTTPTKYTDISAKLLVGSGRYRKAGGGAGDEGGSICVTDVMHTEHNEIADWRWTNIPPKVTLLHFTDHPLWGGKCSKYGTEGSWEHGVGKAEEGGVMPLRLDVL